MAETIETKKVKTDAPDNDAGFYLINARDFNPKVHTEFVEPTVKEPAKAPEADKKPE